MPGLRHRGVARVGQVGDCPSVGVTDPYPRAPVRGRPLRCAGRVLGTGSRPAPQARYQFPAGGHPATQGVHTRANGQVRRRGLSARGTRGLRPPSPHGSRVLPLGRRVPCRSGITPGTAASSHGGVHRETKTGVTRPCPPMKTAPNGCGDVNRWRALRPDQAVHSRALARQVTRMVPTQIGRLPEEFLWLVRSSRARAHTSYPANRAGVPIRLLAGIDGLTARARLLAEQIVDGLELSPHEGRALRLMASEGERIPALRCRSGPVWSSG